MPEPADDGRATGGVARLLGPSALARLAASRVAVVGVGGVGSWAAEALCRSGVGHLRLIDLDHVAESNINRQVQADRDSLGMAKVLALRERLARIAPGCTVEAVEAFVEPGNVTDLLDPAVDFVIDAVDQVAAKAAMVAHARAGGPPIVVCGAAGGRTDPLSLMREDLALTRGDALLASLRSRLRRWHGFPRQPGRRFGIPAICSGQPSLAGTRGAPPGAAGAPLACAGYGSIVTVTATMGFAAAAFAMEWVGRAAPPAVVRTFSGSQAGSDQ